MDDDDLTSEWDTVRNVPKTQTQTPDVDLRSEWIELPVHPDVLYRVIPGYSWRQMALWECQCFAKRTRPHRTPVHEREEYIYQMTRVLVQGDHYTPHPTDTKRYASACSDFCLTLEEAVEKWEQIRQKHFKEARQDHTRLLTEARERIRVVEEYQRLMQEAAQHTLRVEELSRPGEP